MCANFNPAPYISQSHVYSFENTHDTLEVFLTLGAGKVVSIIMNTKRALISVTDKTGILEFAKGLAALGWQILSTGGTAKTLRDGGIDVTDVSDYTGFPEMLDGRVKTLHPKIHGGILHVRSKPDHVECCRQHGIGPIDLVCVNLYAFEQQPDIETIDIGGPSLLRSAAKNHESVIVVSDPADYPSILAQLQSGGSFPKDSRKTLAQKAFARTSAYDQAIASWLCGAPEAIPLRYGENPHQTAFFRPDATPPAEANLASARILHGKEMSYNNYVDGDAALEAAREFHDVPAAVIIKHTNPCGAATGVSLAQALEAAWAGDPVSSYGSVIAVTRTVDLETARFLKGRFVEALIAPGFEADALEFLQQKSKSIRLIDLGQPLKAPLLRTLQRQINGGILTQSADTEAPEAWNVVTTAPFPGALKPLAEFGICVCKHLKSNAIALVWEYAPGYFALLGMGAGQPNRVDSVKKLAIARAKENIALGGWPEADVLAKTVLISDAFFPFADNIEAAAEFGIRYIVEPGGSKHDEDVIAECNRHNIALVMTGARHFLH